MSESTKKARCRIYSVLCKLAGGPSVWSARLSGCLKSTPSAGPPASSRLGQRDGPQFRPGPMAIVRPRVSRTSPHTGVRSVGVSSWGIDRLRHTEAALAPRPTDECVLRHVALRSTLLRVRSPCPPTVFWRPSLFTRWSDMFCASLQRRAMCTDLIDRGSDRNPACKFVGPR